MIKIENYEVMGWEHAIRGMRNPMNSWDKSDSGLCIGRGSRCDTCYIRPSDDYTPCYFASEKDRLFVVGPNDLALMKSLVKAGSDHSKFMRMITVYVDITAPLYLFKEFDTYKVGTTANSTSTMHKIHSKPIELSDFSIDNLDLDIDEPCEVNGRNVTYTINDSIYCAITDLEILRKKYLETNDKRYWRALIQLLPSSYNQKRTVCLNYAVLRNMYHSRKNHKLDEWKDFCKWIETLPYSELITDKEKNNEIIESN